MNFFDAYDKLHKNEQPTKAAVAPASDNITAEEVKAYVDAKMDELNKKVTDSMNEFLKANNIESVSNKVETPQESINSQKTAANMVETPQESINDKH